MLLKYKHDDPTIECILPIIPDPIIELMKLKAADIIELLTFPATTFCEASNGFPSPFSV